MIHARQNYYSLKNVVMVRLNITSTNFFKFEKRSG